MGEFDDANCEIISILIFLIFRPSFEDVRLDFFTCTGIGRRLTIISTFQISYRES